MTVMAADVAHDLAAEQDALDDALATLDRADWAIPTASPRWSIADQVARIAQATAQRAVVGP